MKERTVFVRNLDMEEEKLETSGVGADDLVQSPLEGFSAAYGGVRVALDSRLVHSHQYPSWCTRHLRLTESLTRSLSLCFFF